MKEISAGGVVFYEENKNIQLLMIEDKSQKWTLPKGKTENGETYQETALREIYEETGVKGEIVKPLDKINYEYYQSIRDRVDKEVHFYLVRALTKDILVQLVEINNAKWLKPEEVWDKQINKGYPNNTVVIKKAFDVLGVNII